MIKNPADEVVASRAFEEEVLSCDITDIVYDPMSEKKPPKPTPAPKPAPVYVMKLQKPVNDLLWYVIVY